MVEALAPLHERRAYYAARPDDAMDVLETGSKRAREIAQETMSEVHDAMHI
jgi:tryptophanyl-tRNA synthetase